LTLEVLLGLSQPVVSVQHLVEGEELLGLVQIENFLAWLLEGEWK
jgi:hypothetical protein